VSVLPELIAPPTAFTWPRTLLMSRVRPVTTTSLARTIANAAWVSARRC
jgi:hypothetical protein